MADQRTSGERGLAEREGRRVEQAATPGRRRRSWAVTVVAAGMVAVLLAATLAGFRFVLSDPLPVSYDGPVLAVEPGPGPWPAARVSGELRLQDGCLLVGDAVALFPDGTSWSGPDRVVFADGTTWRVGQQVEGGGGLLPTDPTSDLGDRAVAAATACAEGLGVMDVVLVRP